MDLLIEFFIQAVEAEASDIHLKVGQPPIYRLEGHLYKADAPPVTAEQMMELMNDMLTPGLKETFERQQEADFAWNMNPRVRFRVNLFSSNGESTLSLRYVKNAVQNFESLNLPEQLSKIAMVRRGIVLLAGTTGSGKSTTLGAMINYINDREFRRIITIEDPIEYMFTDNQCVISQREIGLDTETFQTGLRAALRQDPDVIMVGEIRDRNSVETALTAAETGHLIFSTVHGENSVQGLMRVLDMFSAEERPQIRLALSHTLRGMICQRLVPSVDGRVRPACEILANNALVRKLIQEESTQKLFTAIETGKEDGMISFNQSLYQMVKEGVVDQDTAMRFASNPEALHMNLRGIFLDSGSRIVG